MKTNELRISINANSQRVFEFIADPKNEYQYVNAGEDKSIEGGKITIGAIYKNSQNTWEIIDYQKNIFIEILNKDTTHCYSYSFREQNKDKTEITFFEYNRDESDLEKPKKREEFINLKEILEKIN